MDFQGSAQVEQQAFTAFKHKYEGQHPRPEKRLAKRLDWKFKLAAVWAAATVITVAIITSNEFYIIAVMSNVNQLISLARAGTSLVAIEGGIVIAAAIKAGHTKSYAKWLLNAAIYLSVAISIVAGLSASVNAVEGLDVRFILTLHYILVFTLGIGGSLVAWSSGEVLGAEIAEVLSDRDRVDLELAAAVHDYEDELLEAWDRSEERAIARSDLRVQAVEERARVRYAKDETNERANDVRSVVRSSNERPRLPNEGSAEQRLKIEEYLAKIYNSEGRVAGPSEISRAIGVSKAYAHQVKNEWVEANSEAL